ncbi:hypothetical protein OBBRIDRAFT_764402 [Obba rivulosa]|uniref:Uncharacterized protein n=1 Tax=Obba rivulosa TaxID=1052685 RepID=A0A8E2AH51_9APHY|nr:hypothetical protein OBBRIDRAFT_764402 [Obba rivulosa]
MPSTNRSIFSQPSPILDFAWYPAASAHVPATYCFVASVRECPVKLLDASDGRLRASYSIVDHRERQVAPHSLAFNLITDKLYCGFEDAIEVFDVNRPGEGRRLRTTPSKKSRDGLKGIVSALAFSNDASSGVYAAGSLSPSSSLSSNIAIFTEATGEVPVMFVGDENQADSFGIRASVTQLMFNPMQPYLLYASFRRRDAIYTWDVRGDVSVPVQIFTKGVRSASGPDSSQQTRCADLTNQKLRFDIDIGGRWLGWGDQHGDVHIFDLNTGAEDPSGITQPERVRYATEQVLPVATFHAHEDAIGSVSFHPLEPLLLSVSGSRHFDTVVTHPENSDSSSDETDSDSDEDRHSATPSSRRRPKENIVAEVRHSHPQPTTHDDSIKLWSFKSQSENNTSIILGPADSLVQPVLCS